METNNLTQKLKNDAAVMRILATTELRYTIGRTKEQALIELVIRKGEEQYHFYKDSVPLEEVENNALLKIYNLV